MRRALALAWLLLPLLAGAAPPAMEHSLERIRHEWVVAAFELAPERRTAALEILGEMAHRVVERHPGETRPLLWEGIVLASLAEARGPLVGYFTARSARGLLQAIEARESSALDGAGYAALGMLYATAPGWPLSFGDEVQAQAYFERAVASAPGGMEVHYFYGDFLLHQGQYGEATRHLRLALEGPAHCDPGIPGRRERREIRRSLARAERGS